MYCADSQVDLEVAVLEALPLLSAAEAEEEGSDAREEAEGMAMERVSNTAFSGDFTIVATFSCMSKCLKYSVWGALLKLNSDVG